MTNTYRFTFLYGRDKIWWDVTTQVYYQFVYKTMDPFVFKIVLPRSDQQRCKALKGDPYFETEKQVKVFDNVYNAEFIFNVSEDIIFYTNEIICHTIGCKRYELDTIDVQYRYDNEIKPFIHMVYGDLDDELPEQLMSVRFIAPDLKILEIGTNLGRNSMVIAMLLQDQKNLVSIECNKEYYQQAIINRDTNNLKFNMKNIALSTKNVFQKGWSTISSDEYQIEGWDKVETMTFQELESEFKITFDTLILDCEGAFYYIWKEMPDILKNINLIIVENDYESIYQYIEVRDQLYNEGFCCVYQEPLNHMCPMECRKYFYEVYSRI